MPSTTTKKPARTAKKPARGRAATTAAARAKANDHHIDRVMQSLEAAQKDLAAIGGSLGTGARDLRRDATKLVRDARTHVVKMRRSVQRDVGRLQRDLGAAAGARRPARRSRSSSRSA